MRINIQFHGVLGTKELREHVARRIHFQLSRFSKEVSVVGVDISVRGAGNHCRIKLGGPGLESVIVEEESATAQSAIDTAVDRAARTARRKLGKALVAQERKSSVGRTS